ncbi:hypothetical protein EIP91_008621 [Steccherinum ochraceum]|uniref:Alcohol acetyltransferase n=1 Tax=Steccherinum ochraceum TaxID=92696 RepID=A0A4R0RS60_9APHY|nr:hypothetical protein EIP91_008621 [Steccherinum ochraceum]
MEFVGRKPGRLESFYIARDALKLDTSVVVAAEYRHAGHGTLNAHTLFPALREVVKQHRALSIQVHTEATAKASTLAPLATVDISRVVMFHAEDVTLQSFSIDLLMTRMKTGTENPLWRLHVFQDSTVAFVFNHVIGDGKSGVAFHRALLSALNRTIPSTDVADHSAMITIPPTLALIPPLEDCMDITVSWLKFIRVLYNMLAPSSWTSLHTTWTGNDIATKKEFDVSARLLTVSASDAARLAGKSRREGATLTAFLHTVGTVVLSDLITRLPNTTSTTISTSVPVSLRSYTKTPDVAFCNHFSGLNSFVDIIGSPSKRLSAEDFPWDSASHFASTLRQSAKSTCEEVGMLKYVSDMEDFFKGQLGKKRGATMEVSNLGRFPSDEDAPTTEPSWSIGDMFFLQSNAVCGAALNVMVVGSPAGSIGISFIWTKGTVEEDFAESFVSGFSDLVNEISKVEVARDAQ